MSFEPYQDEWESICRLGCVKKYRSGEWLYMQGEKDIGLYCLLKGKIRNSSYLANGAEKTNVIYEAPAFSGETSVIDDNVSVCASRAMTNVEVAIVQRRVARAFIESHPRFMLLLLHNYARMIRGLELQTESACLNTTQKLARMLANFEDYGYFFQCDGSLLPVTHEILASFLGVTRAKVTHALNLFENQSLIHKKRGKIEILDREGLRVFYE